MCFILCLHLTLHGEFKKKKKRDKEINCKEKWKLTANKNGIEVFFIFITKG